MRSYVRRDLVRNPRRTLASLVGVALGVGLFSALLFFIDASAATLTKRAIAPVSIDMQRVLSTPLGRQLSLMESASPVGAPAAGQDVHITLTVVNSTGLATSTVRPSVSSTNAGADAMYRNRALKLNALAAARRWKRRSYVVRLGPTSAPDGPHPRHPPWSRRRHRVGGLF